MVLCRRYKRLELLRGSELSLKFLLRSMAVLSPKKDKQDKYSQAMVQYFLLNAFLVVRNYSYQCYWFSAWQGGTLGNAGCNRGRATTSSFSGFGSISGTNGTATSSLHLCSLLLSTCSHYKCSASLSVHCTLHQQPAPAVDTISDKAVPWLGAQPHPTKMLLVLQNCLYSRALPSTAGQGRITISSLLTELVRLQEA